MPFLGGPTLKKNKTTRSRFRLVENKCSVLIAACDTFRAGAVEQLRTHMKRLNSLHPSAQGEKQSGKKQGPCRDPFEGHEIFFG